MRSFLLVYFIRQYTDRINKIGFLEIWFAKFYNTIMIQYGLNDEPFLIDLKYLRGSLP